MNVRHEVLPSVGSRCEVRGVAASRIAASTHEATSLARVRLQPHPHGDRPVHRFRARRPGGGRALPRALDKERLGFSGTSAGRRGANPSGWASTGSLPGERCAIETAGGAGTSAWLIGLLAAALFHLPREASAADVSSVTTLLTISHPDGKRRVHILDRGDAPTGSLP